MLIALTAAATFCLGTADAAQAPKKTPKKAPAKARAGLLEIPKVAKDEVICFALYTVHDGVLKLTAQLYPLDDGDPRSVRLQVKQDGQWKQIATTEIVNPGWTAPFRVENWDMTRQLAYRVQHGESAVYEGIIRRNPVDKQQIVVAAFTGNSIYPGHGGDIPKDDILKNLEHIKPDLLFFSGDQVYDHNRHYAYWLRFGRDFGDVIRNTPTITIPDDHDVGMANIWGAGGKQSFTGAGHDGGYFKPVEYVKEVERAQTSHLPDPFDPTPVLRGIGVYYTDLNWGGVSFAILEDRKFKTGPSGVIPKMGPRPDHVNTPGFDPKVLDVPEAKLLGERQLKFLRHWAADWRDADMKAVLSQTIFCGGAHLHGSRNNRILADLDSNGWPQTGRNKALAEIRRGFALHIAGDQHLATIMHHGIDEFEDAGYSFCVPSIANLYLRWWLPLEPGKNRQPGMPDYTGQFHDGFDNKLTVHAVANPTPEENRDKLTTRSAGFGVVRFNKPQRTMTLECWPRNVDATDPAAKQYPGWPKTIAQTDNYGRKAVAYLPTLKIRGTADPVVQVIDESDGQIVYTLRIQGNEFRPKVFAPGKYTVKLTSRDGKTAKFQGIEALPPDQESELSVEF
ncbi:MAG: alkaline phosphatase D family protein [Candidatus Nealsonbacteria bacterium]|nr:alkaline phosphatase D family protein [Candidatus Nealsonbacteria bacterium]